MERLRDFIHDDFLLHSESARRLYHGYAAEEPILDFHSHLPAGDIALNRTFHNLVEIWLEGDHYKWRAMRANGVPERFCTGDAAPYEKFLAWARTVPFAVRNPLYLWTHLELKRYFGIRKRLDESTAQSIWDAANSQLAEPEFSSRGLLEKFRVRALCTSDDPCDGLAAHRTIAASGAGCAIYPTFRPDKALFVHVPAAFNAWVSLLGETAGLEIKSLDAFLDALKRRHDYFHANGCRLSDHGLPYCFALPCTETEAATIFSRVRSGHPAALDEQERFASFLMLFFGRLDADKGWTKQLHLGAMRAVNTRAVGEIGPDTGFDTIGDHTQGVNLCHYLDALDREHALPKTIIYNLNPADNYLFAAAIGNFQDGSLAGKVQLGSAWWFLDQKEGIESQLNALSNVGLLSRFVGMVTDSRSFMSFPRHEYFRRVLCNLVGQDMENGELPDDENFLGGVVRRICFENARQFLELAVSPNSGGEPTEAVPVQRSEFR